MVVKVDLNSLRVVNEADGPGGSEPYMWPVFFKIDWETMNHLNTPSVWSHAPNGSHRNLGGNYSFGDDQIVSIPSRVGEWTTKLVTNAAMPTSTTMVGAVVVFLEEDAVPSSHAVDKKYYPDFVRQVEERIQGVVQNALRSTGGVLPTGGSATTTNALERELTKQIKDKLNNDEWYSGLRDIFSLGFANVDDFIGAGVFLWSYDQIEKDADGTIGFAKAWNESTGAEDGAYVLSGNVTRNVSINDRVSGGFFGANWKWHDLFSFSDETPATGDFNGDGRDDLVTFTRDGRVYVGLAESNAYGFASPATNWHNGFRTGNEVPLVGDFNGDGKDDIAKFTRGESADVYVALSNGRHFGPAIRWNGSFAHDSQTPLVGDFNGDGKDDIVSFTRGSTGDAYVSLSNGSEFAAPRKWHDWFSIQTEIPLVGDFNGDGKDDVVTFTRGSRGDVFVALSNGTQFVGSGWKWHDWFSINSEIPRVGDFDGDGKDDIATFTRGIWGDVYVALSNGRGFEGTSWKWHDSFCFDVELPATGDFNGDGRDDLASFARGNRGDVYVALSTARRKFPEPTGAAASLNESARAAGSSFHGGQQEIALDHLSVYAYLDVESDSAPRQAVDAVFATEEWKSTTLDEALLNDLVQIPRLLR
jgi:hypothetical protein